MLLKVIAPLRDMNRDYEVPEKHLELTLYQLKVSLYHTRSYNKKILSKVNIANNE